MKNSSVKPNNDGLIDPGMDAEASLTLLELSSACSINSDEIEELIGYGALHPLNTDEPVAQFSHECVVPLRTANRLRRDYDLDLFTVVIMMDFLLRIDMLECEVNSLKARH